MLRLGTREDLEVMRKQVSHDKQKVSTRIIVCGGTGCTASRSKDFIDAINKAHDQGGIVVCNHIPWSVIEAKYKNHPTRENLLEWGVDYIEIVNDDSQPENVFDQESYDFCMKHNGEIGMITGTDMHKPDGLVSGGVHGWTLLNLKELTEEVLLEELRKKKTKILYSKEPYLDPGIHK